MTTKTKEYLEASIIVVIIILLIFIFNLPKTFFYNLAIVVLVLIIFNELFPHKKKYSRKREYITSGLLYLVLAVVIFIFDLPKKLYFFIGILAISSIVLSELFNLIKDKEK